MINYTRKGDFVLILIKDGNDNTIFKKMININNHREYFDTMLSIAEKYGFKPEVDIDKSVDAKNEVQQEKDREKIDWFS